jgi:hypothetical protein
MTAWDQDALDAGLDLVGRTGAKSIEIGFLHEDVPVEEAGWYAHVQYHGARVTSEDHKSPVDAVEGLARQLLESGLCAFCGERIALADFPGKRCRWTRNGKQWTRGCEATHTERIPAIVEAGRIQARGPSKKRRR